LSAVAVTTRDGNRSNQNTPLMRRITTTREISSPTPENSAIETNCAVSEFSAGVEEMPVVFGTAALASLWLLTRLLPGNV
jgi:hypothetical protein